MFRGPAATLMLIAAGIMWPAVLCAQRMSNPFTAPMQGCVQTGADVAEEGAGLCYARFLAAGAYAEIEYSRRNHVALDPERQSCLEADGARYRRAAIDFANGSLPAFQRAVNGLAADFACDPNYAFLSQICPGQRWTVANEGAIDCPPRVLVRGSSGPTATPTAVAPGGGVNCIEFLGGGRSTDCNGGPAPPSPGVNCIEFRPGEGGLPCREGGQEPDATPPSYAPPATLPVDRIVGEELREALDAVAGAEILPATVPGDVPDIAASIPPDAVVPESALDRAIALLGSARLALGRLAASGLETLRSFAGTAQEVFDQIERVRNLDERDAVRYALCGPPGDVRAGGRTEPIECATREALIYGGADREKGQEELKETIKPAVDGTVDDLGQRLLDDNYSSAP